MKDLIRLTDIGREGIYSIFEIADRLERGEYRDFLEDRCVVLFFSASSIRTRVSFEKGVHMLGGQSVLFPSDTLDKREDLRDVFGYLDNWADAAVIRHRDIEKLGLIAGCSRSPVINAMTDANHPCEILSDLYALKTLGRDIISDRYLFCGIKGNISLAWKEAADVLGFELAQCCPAGYEIEGVKVYRDPCEAFADRDIILTDSLPAAALDHLKPYQVTAELMAKAAPGALLDPCPPFYRGEEVSADAIDSGHFVGYGFKKHLLRVQQAVMIYCMTDD